MSAPTTLTPEHISTYQRLIATKLCYWRGRYHRSTSADGQDASQQAWVELLERGLNHPRLDARLDAAIQSELYTATHHGRPRTKVPWDVISVDDERHAVHQIPSSEHIERHIFARLALLDAWQGASDLEREALTLGPDGWPGADQSRPGWSVQRYRAAILTFGRRIDPDATPATQHKAAPPSPVPDGWISMKDAAAILHITPPNTWRLAKHLGWELLYFADRSTAQQRNAHQILYVELEVVRAYLATKAHAPVRRTRGCRSGAHARRPAGERQP